MKRRDIMVCCPEEFEDTLKDIIDYFEGKFNSIKDNLEIGSIEHLCKIEEAYKIASDMAQDLY